jgi:hypothetical protein
LSERIEYAKDLWEKLSARKTEASRAQWDLDRSFHNLQLNAVGASGIQHRVIEDRSALLAELEERINIAEKVLDMGEEPVLQWPGGWQHGLTRKAERKLGQ